MLVLSRRIEEVLFFHLPSGDKIEVKVVRIGDGQVRLGIVAPANVYVARAEVDAMRLRAVEPPVTSGRGNGAKAQAR